jgi:hypothetical protein
VNQLHAEAETANAIRVHTRADKVINAFAILPFN